MSLQALSGEDREVIRRCLVAVADGQLFEDWEFPSLMGVSRRDVQSILAMWPEVDDSEESVSLSINNAIVNLLGYPHGQDVARLVGVDKDELTCLLECWRGAKQSSA